MSGRRLEYVDLDELVPAERNGKGHDSAAIARSVERFGVIEIPVVDERTGRLVAGHGRREDYLDRRERGEPAPEGVRVVKGRWRVPVVRGWASRDDAEALAAGVALNRSGELGGWVDSLAAILTDLAALEGGLDATGFTDDDLANLLHLEAIKAEREARRAELDEIPPPPRKPVTRKGDLWILGEHRVICGDAGDAATVDRVLDGAPIDFAFTSPPYNVGVEYDEHADSASWREYSAFLERVVRVMVDRLEPGRFLGWNIGAAPRVEPFRQGVMLQELGLTFHRQLIWWKGSVPMPTYYITRKSGKTRIYHPNPVHEFVWLFSKGAPRKGGAGDYDEELLRDDLFRIQSTESTRDLWKDDQQRRVGTPGKGTLAHARGNVHPAPFPVRLPQGFIGYLADRGAVVFDPFAGSGATIVAAHALRRRGVGVEISPAYCDVIAERYQRLTEQLPILERTGKPVDFLARRASPNP